MCEKSKSTTFRFFYLNSNAFNLHLFTIFDPIKKYPVICILPVKRWTCWYLFCQFDFKHSRFVLLLCESSEGLLTLFSRLHWYVSLHMSPQITFDRAGKDALVAFVWLFSTVYFQMSHQSTWIKGCIITLDAFVWLFSTVYFHAMWIFREVLKKGPFS